MRHLFKVFGNARSVPDAKKFILLSLIGLWSSFQVYSQSEIRGKVVDDKTYEPIIGATVSLPSSSDGVLTDLEGAFLIQTKQSLPITLSVSFLGYKAQEVEVYEAEEEILITLTENVNYLNEVVVIGYGTQTKQEFTGSAVRIAGDALKELPVQSFDQALSGRAAGVNISIPNGVLNNPPVIRVRGINSISLSSYPLIVIDGVPVVTGEISTSTNMANNPLSDLNPADIESIDVLKDAASTSIYGSRAAAGVLLITTKKGKNGRLQAHYDGWVSVTNATRLPKLLNSQQYMDIKNEAVLNSKILSGNADNEDVASALFFPSYQADGSLVDTRWYDYIYQTAVSHNHAFSVSGGTEKTDYYFSANYTNQEGILVGNEFERKAIRLNIGHEVNRWLKVRASASYNVSTNRAYNSGSLPGSSQLLIGAARLATSLPPNVSPYKEDGSYNISSTGQLGMGNNKAASTLYNPLALFEYSRNTSDNDRFLGNISADLRIIKQLTFNTTYAIDRLKNENQVYLSPLLGSSGYGVGGSITNITALYDNQNWTNTLNFDDRYGSHHVSALLGTDFQQYKYSRWGVYATQASDEFFEYYQGGWGNISASGNGLSEKVYVSGFARVNYDYDGKYFIGGNFRRDGNSALAKGRKFGNFGGVSGGWIISEERFYRGTSFSRIINNLKLSASWGRVGNGNLTNEYGAFNLYSSSLYGEDATWALSQAGNTELTWETSEQTNIGLNFSALHHRIEVELAYFNNNVNGLILSTPQAPSKGIPDNSILTNIGSMYNRGVEAGINVNLIEKKDFNWDVSFNYTNLRNKVTALAGDEDIIGYTHTAANSNNITRVGHSVGSLYGALTDGVNPENGRRIFINAAGERVQYSAAVAAGESNWTYEDGSAAPAITSEDYYVLGNSLPEWYGGLVTNLRYKDFDLSLNFTYSGGNYMMNGTKGTLREQTFYNNSTDILNRWTTVGDITNIPRLVYNDIISNGTSFPISENVEKADFLRLQNIALGYRLPSRYLKQIALSSIRVYAQVNNAFLLTRYSGTDPESSSNGNSNTSPGVERNSAGRGRTFTFGVNIGF